MRWRPAGSRFLRCEPPSPSRQIGQMLRGIRNASSGWVGKIIMAVVMGVLIVSFGIWGIADIFRGFGQSTVAKVGGTEISVNEFRQLYTDRLQQIGRQFGRPLTMDQARADRKSTRLNSSHSSISYAVFCLKKK